MVSQVVKPIGAVLSMWYSDRDTVLLILDGHDSGYIYECSFDMERPLQATPMHNHNDASVSAVAFTTDSSHALLGGADGSLRVHSLTSLDQSMQLSMHAAAVTQVSVSFDNAFAMSIGKDGNVFVYKTAFADASSSAELTQDESMAPVEDIVDPKAYSLEEMKQKADQDAKLRTAEDRKMDVRREIAQLRKEFKLLLGQVY